jgi:hypothetical protein
MREITLTADEALIERAKLVLTSGGESAFPRAEICLPLGRAPGTILMSF